MDKCWQKNLKENLPWEPMYRCYDNIKLYHKNEKMLVRFIWLMIRASGGLLRIEKLIFVPPKYQKFHNWLRNCQLSRRTSLNEVSLFRNSFKLHMVVYLLYTIIVADRKIQQICQLREFIGRSSMVRCHIQTDVLELEVRFFNKYVTSSHT